MPEGVDPSIPEDAQSENDTAPIDSVTPPANEDKNEVVEEEPETEDQEENPEESAEQSAKKKKILMMVLAGVGAFILFYLFFAFYLMVSLPVPDGSGQGLKVFGNMLYGIVSVLSLATIGLLALRMIRSGAEGSDLQRALMKPGILVAFLLMIAVMVFASINRQISLPIDILEPKNIQNLIAPTTVTFGTQTLRGILQKQSLAVNKYKWNFDGDNTTDADTAEQEVTTVYKKKGVYPVSVRVLLNNGKVRTARTVIVIPNAVFDVSPESPILDESILLDATNLVSDPTKVDSMLWDFNGDGIIDFQSIDLFSTNHTFTELGTHQVRVTIRYTGGLQEEFTRPITVVEEREQPFDVSIETEGELTGVAPLGLIFRSKVEEGIIVRDTKWIFAASDARGINDGEEELGDRVSYIFERSGNFRVTLIVTDDVNRVSRSTANVSVLEPLTLGDVVVSGTPKLIGKTIEGRSPLEIELSASTKTPFITFKWEQEGASRVFSAEDTYHARYQDDGTFPLVLIATDVDGRTQKFPFDVNVLPPKSRVSFTAIPSTGIAPLTVSFDASQSFIPEARITGFSWLFGDEEDNNRADPQILGAHVTHRYESEGTFIVDVNALTEEGQSFNAKKTIVVRSPTLDACFFPSRSVGTAPMEVRFDAGCSTGNIEIYKWTFGDGNTSEETEPFVDHIFNTPGTYMTSLEVGDEKGDFSQITVELTVQ